MERKIIAKNNMPIYYYTNSSLHKFCITVCVKAGNLYDKKEELGIAHFWEHIVFRNINAVLEDRMKQRIDSIGAYFNGCTYNEFVEIKIIAAKKHFRECAQIISKVFAPIEVSKEQVDLERKRVKSEIREDDEKNSIDYMGRKIVWKGTNLAKSIAGTNEILDTIDGERLGEYAKEILTPSNALVYVTGAATKEDISILSEYIGEYKLNEKETKKENIAPVPDEFFNRDIAVKIKKSDYYEVRYSFDFDTRLYSKEYIDVIYDILFNGECSKVYDELSEKTGIIYSYDSIIDIYNNIGAISFSYEVKSKHLLTSIIKIMQILNNLKKGLLDELDFVMPNYIDNADILLDECERLNGILVYESHILENHYKTIEDRKKLYSSITKENLLKAMNHIFRKENLVINLKVKKKKSIAKKDVRNIVNEYL